MGTDRTAEKANRGRVQAMHACVVWAANNELRDKVIREAVHHGVSDRQVAVLMGIDRDVVARVRWRYLRDGTR